MRPFAQPLFTACLACASLALPQAALATQFPVIHFPPQIGFADREDLQTFRGNVIETFVYTPATSDDPSSPPIPSYVTVSQSVLSTQGSSTFSQPFFVSLPSFNGAAPGLSLSRGSVTSITLTLQGSLTAGPEFVAGEVFSAFQFAITPFLQVSIPFAPFQNDILPTQVLTLFPGPVGYVSVTDPVNFTIAVPAIDLPFYVAGDVGRAGPGDNTAVFLGEGFTEVPEPMGFRVFAVGLLGLVSAAAIRMRAARNGVGAWM